MGEKVIEQASISKRQGASRFADLYSAGCFFEIGQLLLFHRFIIFQTLT
jgi:hypothetical protein